MTSIILRGDKTAAARLLPLAKKKLAHYKEHAEVFSNSFKVQGADITVKSAAGIDTIQIRAGGMPRFTISTAVFGMPRDYWTYSPNTSRWFLQKQSGEWPLPGGITGRPGNAVVFRGYANVYWQPQYTGNIIKEPMFRVKKSDGTVLAKTNWQNLTDPYTVVEPSSGPTGILHIGTGVNDGNLYREGNREYTYAYVAIAAGPGSGPGGPGETFNVTMYLVSRDITSLNLNWDVDYVLGTWLTDGYNSDSTGVRAWKTLWAWFSIPGADNTTRVIVAGPRLEYNKQSVYIYSYIHGGSGAGATGTNEIWRYDRAEKAIALERTWTVGNHESNASPDDERLMGFLHDPSGRMVGYVILKPYFGANLGVETFYFYSGPQVDTGSMTGGLSAAPIIFTITPTTDLGLPAFTTLLSFWKIRGGVVVENGQTVDNAIYGLYFSYFVESPWYGYPSRSSDPGPWGKVVYARWSKKKGLERVLTTDTGDFELIHKQFVMTRNNYADSDKMLLNMLTDELPDGSNPKAKIVRNAKFKKSGEDYVLDTLAPISGGFYESG